MMNQFKTKQKVEETMYHPLHNTQHARGISLISLIITIIVIIILAAIVIFTGLNTPDRANFAKFVSEFSDFHTAITQDYMQKKANYAIQNKTRSDAQIYYAIAKNGDYSGDINDTPTGEGTVASLNTNLGGVAPEALTGEYYYEITKDTNVAEWKNNKGYYEPRNASGERHYVTDAGEPFILPGYRVQEEGQTKWYVNERKYYISDTPVTVVNVETNTPTTNTWTYDHASQTVTNGTLTLNIGDYVNTTPYTVDGKSFDGSWRVLGEENGQLLLVSANYVDFQGSTVQEGTPLIQLQGSNGIDNEVSRLNTLCAKFADGAKTENGRSIKVEDINKITGYNPMEARMNANDLTQKTPFDYGDICQYKNNVTYTLKSDGKVWYKGDQAKTTETQSSYTKFWLPGTDSNITEPFTIQSTGYVYYPETYGPFPATAVASGQTMEGISSASPAYDMLFKPQSYIAYWLASPCVFAYEGVVDWRLFIVSMPGMVGEFALWGSCAGSLRQLLRLRGPSCSFSKI